MDWKFYPKSKTVEKHRPSFAHDPPQIIVIKQKTMPKVMNVTDQTLITCENDNMHVKSILKKENNSFDCIKAVSEDLKEDLESPLKIRRVSNDSDSMKFDDSISDSIESKKKVT
jgi:DNA-binding XRE family transcriptional regulator